MSGSGYTLSGVVIVMHSNYHSHYQVKVNKKNTNLANSATQFSRSVFPSTTSKVNTASRGELTDGKYRTSQFSVECGSTVPCEICHVV